MQLNLKIVSRCHQNVVLSCRKLSLVYEYSDIWEKVNCLFLAILCEHNNDYTIFFVSFLYRRVVFFKPRVEEVSIFLSI